MPSLDLYKSRKYSVVTLGDKKEYKIPSEYTVEEVERLLELRRAQEEIEHQTVEEKSQDEQVASFWAVVFDQLEIVFQHHQGDITADYLRKVVTQNEALEILGFFQKYRQLAFKKEVAGQPDQTEPKKKLN